ncbi:MAG: HAMP domain-containing sensor histidine kinase, partial [Actinomycetes bacterium]
MKSPFRHWSLKSRLTLGVVLLSAIAFAASSIAANYALRGYLVTQIDSELISVASGSLPQVQRSGIERDDEYNPVPKTKTGNPVRRIPTATSLTLLGADGKVSAQIGGDLNGNSKSPYVAALTVAEISSHNGKPFTVETPESDIRVVALPFSNGQGTVIAAKSLGELDRTIAKLRFLFLLISLILLIIILIAARTVIRVGLRPLNDVEVTAEEIAHGNLSARLPDADPATEVGRLVTSLNTMLSRIEESFSVQTQSENKLRRFVADASHELRTPITAIRGFSELHRQGAVTGAKETSELIGRIENESKRMGSLVEDLLLLARLDQAREMDTKPVDINKVVEEAVISARAAGPHHPVKLISAGAEIFTLGDESRIHQVVANLLANARAHTPAGTPITVSLSTTDAGVEVTVADKGPGLSIEDQRRIFERFYRADESRVRTGDDGSGLGLSIVDAIMQAHGGSVSVKSELGTGS